MAVTASSDSDFASLLVQACGKFILLGARGQTAISGEVRVTNRAGIRFVEFGANLQQMSRSRQEIVHDGRDDLILITQRAGNALISQHEASHWLQPGDLVLIDSAEPSEFTFFGELSRQSIALFPGGPVVDLMQANSTLGSNFAPRHHPINSAITAVLQSITSVVEPDQNVEPLLKSALITLVAAMASDGLTDETEHKEERGSGTYIALQMSRQYIDSRYRDANFNIPGMAATLRISLRQIQRGFASIGTTPTKYLLIRRLEHARREIDMAISGRRTDRISTIAFAAGFSDLSYFQKTFRRAFGNTPREYLQGVGERIRAVANADVVGL